MRPEFAFLVLEDDALEGARQIGEALSAALDAIVNLVPAGRERALVVVKLQEAAFFAKRGLALSMVNP